MKHYIFCFRELCFSYISDVCQNCVNSGNLLIKVQWRFGEPCTLTGEPCTCESVNLLQSFHRGTLNIQWYIAQNCQPTFSMSVLLRRSFKIAFFSRFLKVVISTSNIYLTVFYILTVLGCRNQNDYFKDDSASYKEKEMH